MTKLDEHVTRLAEIYGDELPVSGGIVELANIARAVIARATGEPATA